MSQEYEIAEVRLENYRQYYGVVNVEFTSENSKFAALIGKNGAGKSNLLNAINWCLFHKEPHMQPDGKLPIMNIQAIEEAERESKIEMSVSVILQQGTTKYNIMRKLAVIKHELKKNDSNEYEIVNLVDLPESEPMPSGFERIRNQSVTTFQRSKEEGTWEDQTKTHTFNAVVGHILPEKLSKFFLLDGEFLEKFFEGNYNINHAVEQISQLSVLKSTLGHMEVFESTSGQKGYDDQVMNELSEKIKIHNKWIHSLTETGEDDFLDGDSIPGTTRHYHKSGKPRRDDLAEALAYWDSKRKQIRKKLYEENRRSNEDLQRDIDRIEGIESTLGDNIKERVTEHRSLIIGQGPKIMLADALKTTVNAVDNEIEKGMLPNSTKITFTDDLLEKGHCICGASLKEGTDARSNVEEMRKKVHDDLELDLANDIKYANNLSLKNMNETRKKIGNNMEKINELEIKLQKTHEERLHLQRQIVADADDNYLQTLHEADQIDADYAQIQKEHDGLTTEIRRREEDLKSLKLKQYNMGIKNKKVARHMHELMTSRNAYEILKSVYNDLSQSVRHQIQDKTTEYFKRIMWKKDFFDRVEIDEQYRLKLFTVTGFNAIDNLAAGEKLFLAFAFVAALREITGYKFPLVVDSPLGKVAGTPRRLLAKQLPDFLPNSQLTLLVTDAEYLLPLPIDEKNPKPGESFSDILLKKVNVCESIIEFAENRSQISPYERGQSR